MNPQAWVKSKPAATQREQGRAEWLPWLLIVLGTVAMYASSMTLPFLGDDYVFLDETRFFGFTQLWSRSNLQFGWYRPWSRELYFWTLRHLVGLDAAAFRAANLLLWVVSLLVLGRVVRRISNQRIAVTAIAGSAVLGLWGAPLVWISGSQDLWLVFFLSLTLLAALSRHPSLALFPFGAALLSKETAAAFPMILAGLWYFVEKRRGRELARRVLPFVVLTVAWAVWHPILLRRLLHPRLATLSAEPSLPAWQVGLKTVQAMLNLDQVGGTFVFSPVHLVGLGLGALLLAAAVRIAGRDDSPAISAERSRGLLWTGCAWAVAGWLPLFMPSLGWHAYYGCLGALGAWLAIAVMLRGDPELSLVLVLLLGTFRLFNSSTESREWGSEWYQRRAGDLLGRVRGQLLELRPAMPTHARSYFGGLPNNVGLVAGDTPALRVWYGDSTLRGGYWSQYGPRRAGEPPGPDLFFHYDPVHGLREVHLGPEDANREMASHPLWEFDHESLALALFLAHAPGKAGDEYEKIAQLSGRGDALVAAAMCREVAGDTPASRALIERAALRLGQPAGVVADSVRKLRSRVLQALR